MKGREEELEKAVLLVSGRSTVSSDKRLLWLSARQRKQFRDVNGLSLHEPSTLHL
jgi:hypothetical protein